MKKLFVVLLHVVFWTCYLILIGIILGVYYRSSPKLTNQAPRIINAFVSLFFFAFIPSLISYFTYYFILFPKYFKQKKFLLSIIYGVLVSAIASFISYLLLRYLIESGILIDMDEGGRKGRSTAVRTIAAMTFIGIISGIAAMVINGFITWFNEIKLKELLKEKNHEMELELIKLQLDPHLLFNTINNIDALILKDAEAASDYLNKLSDLMRFILYETKVDRIPLVKEIEYIEKYIALQKIRTANENYVHLSVKGSIGRKMIAPMVFIPFIENAFKHAKNKKIENAITVSIIVNDEIIQLICENKFDAKSKLQYETGGLGNDLIQKRLHLIYAGKHTLEVHKTDDLYSINLIIPHG